MISKNRFSIKFQILIAVLGLVSVCNCLPSLAEPQTTKGKANNPANAKAPASEASPAEAHLTAAQKAALAAQRKKWLLAQRAESGGTGEGAWQLIHRPMDLPNLPSYTGTGATFVEGLMYPNKPGGAAISLTYRAKEAPDVVMSWYEDALANYHWKIQKVKADNGNLTAYSGDNSVTVNVRPAKQKGYRTDFKLTFKLARK